MIDPAFERVPFERWLSEPAQTHFHWTVDVPRAQLSFHQRMESRIEIEVDGRDLDSRRSHGELVCFFQITGREGARFQSHLAIALDKLNENVKDATIQSAQRAFFLPGDYQLAAALLDTGTGEHASIQTKFRVPPLPSSFLKDASTNLPAVEFIHQNESPESWFLPDIQGHLNLFTSLHSATGLNIVLNLAESLPTPGTRSTPSEGLPALVPTLKALSQTANTELLEHIEVLDLARHRSVFRQELKDPTQPLEWNILKASLNSANTASIDLRSLSDSHRDAQFFVSEIRRLLRSYGEATNLLILTTPIAFQASEDLTPISTESLPACRVFYIRYHAAPERSLTPSGPQMRGRGRGINMGSVIGRDQGTPINLADRLEATLKPLNPKLFDVETPEEIARALAEIQRILGK